MHVIVAPSGASLSLARKVALLYSSMSEKQKSSQTGLSIWLSLQKNDEGMCFDRLKKLKTKKKLSPQKNSNSISAKSSIQQVNLGF